MVSLHSIYYHNVNTKLDREMYHIGLQSSHMQFRLSWLQ